MRKLRPTKPPEAKAHLSAGGAPGRPLPSQRSQTRALPASAFLLESLPSARQPREANERRGEAKPGRTHEPCRRKTEKGPKAPPAGRPAGGALGPFSVFRRHGSCVLPGFASPRRSFASLGCRAEGKLSSRKADAGSALVCERCEGRGLPGAPPAERWALASGGFVGLSFLIPPHLLLWLMRLRKRSPEFHTPSRCTFFLWLFCGSARCCVFVFQWFAAAVPAASVSLPSEG